MFHLSCFWGSECFIRFVFCVICLSWIGLFVHLLLTFTKTGRVRVNSLFIFQVSSRTCVTSLLTGEMHHNTHLKWNTGHRVQAVLQPHFSPQAVGGLFSCPCGLAFCPHTKSYVFSDLKKSFGKLGKKIFRKLSLSPQETVFFIDLSLLFEIILCLQCLNATLSPASTVDSWQTEPK